jgi:hypothetical protein
VISLTGEPLLFGCCPAAADLVRIPNLVDFEEPLGVWQQKAASPLPNGEGAHEHAAFVGRF